MPITCTKDIKFDLTTGRRFYFHDMGRRVFLCNYEKCLNNARVGGICVKHGAKSKLCSVEGCENKVKNNGKCFNHGAKKYLCSVEGCENKVQNNGKCFNHGAKKYLCSVEGCENKAKNNGKCIKHGAKKYLCSVEGCGNQRKNNGKCFNHGAKKYLCSVEGCLNERKNNRKCIKHGALYPKQSLCKTCRIVRLSNNRKKLGIEECMDCEIRGGKVIDKQRRLELIWLDKFEEWGYYPSIHDKVIRDWECNTVNLRRPDFIFTCEDSFPCHVLVECDENSHGGIPIPCEMARLQEVHDQIVSNTGLVKPLLVIRFNPNSSSDIESELRECLDSVLVKRNFILGDARGVNIHKIIGYGNKRKDAYENSRLTKRIKISS